ncbi:Cbb3-type cytochrome c oxidase subunit FixP [Pseudovibrio axinellae]|uniref:Cbb3-type cytochrome c oxidase subunit n=1 Tax=Pseudovibrio axinellae TaxID=989403 RepID=A0A165YLC0_9HYPH|nr:cytochrome-c oxidase, cbb3-type subunit III [Pseudovibrio axinellae]KZL18948.1 Cbb3-type cytochrome c oxidase subunit FixP [Pseudovibrio axinellae]SEP86620.1 cytochrome c oxidase cbb3-type subunit 3 [Pseudovibrio axinellae]
MAEYKKEIDQVTGVETTGHEWDGLKELNHPLPKWWLYMFYASIVWSVIYWVLMPSWPLVNGYTKGLLDYSQRAVVTAEFNAAEAERAETGKMLLEASLEEIRDTPELLEFAMAQGKVAFGDNCAPCHGAGATGFEGYPNLQDDSWIWGGDLDTLATTISYGVRAEHDDTRYAEMPAFGRDEMLEKDEIIQVANYVGSVAGLPTRQGVDLEAGKVVYEENCAACHMEDAKGSTETGSPNLTAPTYLYGKSVEDIIAQVDAPRHGVMPAWIDRLGETTVKSLAVYVHSLGGGQ